MFYFLSVIAAVLISVMIVVNGDLASGYNVYIATVIIHITGFFVTSCVCAMRKIPVLTQKKLPITMYLGGAIGVATTMFNTMAYGRISVSSIVALSLVGQSVTSLIIDQFGFFNLPVKRFSRSKLIGLLFTFAGVAYMLIGTKFVLIPVILSIITGVSIVVSRCINAQLADKTDVLYSTWYNYLVGLTVSAVILLIASRMALSPLQMPVSPKVWAYLGGTIGVIVVSILNIITPKLPAFQLSLILFAGQMFSGIILDYFISRQFSISSLIGGVFVTVGLALNARLDNRSKAYKSAC